MVEDPSAYLDCYAFIVVQMRDELFRRVTTRRIFEVTNEIHFCYFNQSIPDLLILAVESLEYLSNIEYQGK